MKTMESEEGYTYKERDELYKIKKELEKTTEDTEEYKEEKPQREVKRVTRKSMPKLHGDDFSPLIKTSSDVIGNLFDRVKFLNERVSETKESINLRKELHKEIINGIDADIQDKLKLLKGLSDIDDIRDFKLDISALRMEKRRENVQFWRDITELNAELRKLMEDQQTESKIADLFKELGD